MKKEIFKYMAIGILVALGMIIARNVYIEHCTEDWQKAYMGVLLKKELEDGTELNTYYFTLFDFDEDGIPELLLPGGDEAYEVEDIDGAWDVWSDTYSIHRYSDGEVERILFDEADGVNMDYEIDTRNLIINYPCGQGMPAVLCEYVDGEFIELAYAYGGEEGLVVYPDIAKKKYYVVKEYFSSSEALAGESSDFFYYEINMQNIRDIVLNYE